MVWKEQLCPSPDGVAVVTGGGGVLCGALSVALAEIGLRVAVLDVDVAAAQKVAGDVKAAGGQAMALEADVLSRADLEHARTEVIVRFGGIDYLINGAGGTRKEATTSDELSFFDLPQEAVAGVLALNFMGTFLACQVFGATMAEAGQGVILNVSSMAALRPLTRAAAYSAAKAAVSNLTCWLAVHLAQEYSPRIRVNALAPGFFLTTQNRFLLVDERSGELTVRGHAIIEHTPLGEFGKPEDLIGAAMWLLSPSAWFVTGAVIPVDGGFSAYSGV